MNTPMPHPSPNLPHRRDFLKSVSAGALALTCLPGLSADNSETRATSWTDAYGLTRLGTLKTKSAKEIKSSPLSVGMECLDRRMYSPERTYDCLAALGVKWARVQTGWSRCETERERYDFGWLDEVVDSILKTGVQPWFNLGYGNRLYTPAAPDVSAVGWAPIDGDAARQGWVRFVAALADHFRTRVRHWEIWNEANISHFWQPTKSSPAGYMDLVKLTAPVIRGRMPDVVLIGGAFSGMPAEFLKGCLEQGLADHVQKISYHPYVLIPEKGYASALADWRKMLARFNPSVTLWQGECGCPSSQGGVGALAQHNWNEQRQAKWLLRRTLLDLGQGLELISYFHMVDLVRYNWAGKTVLENKEEKPRTNFRATFGLLRGDDYSVKPSYRAYQRLCSLFDAQTKPADLAASFAGKEAAGHADNIVQACFVRGPHPLYTYWLPEDVQRDSPAQAVAATIHIKQDLTLREPVLVDLLTGDIYRLPGEQKAGEWTFTTLPVADYPLLLTDAAAAIPGRRS